MHDPAYSNSESLLALALAGDGDALGRLLAQYRNYLKLLAQVQIDRRLRGKVDPSDLVQDTFLYAHQAFESFRGKTEAEMLGWLRQVLGSKLKDLVRRFYEAQRRDVRLERRLDEELDQTSHITESLAASDSSPSEKVARGERAVLVADAVAQLPPDYREVIVLRHMEELPFQEIALRMERSEGSVRQLWIRGLAKLRRVFGGTIDDND